VRSIPEIQQAMNELETSRLDAIWARDDDAERACNRAYGVLATELKRAESRQASVVSSRPAERWQEPQEDNRSLLKAIQDLTRRVEQLEAKQV